LKEEVLFMSKTQEETPLARLESLRAALKQLTEQPLLAETRAALEEAIQAADQLVDPLATKPGGGGRLEALNRVSQALTR
jgi:hypothetical protein